ncbi:hypothetical protein [Mycolicibacterium moriokaense]|uniref:hypothetical protein n=1 Tax=Mycolicibacterium moriokaense TaxID=39691 RepID=UPI000D76C32A|nr:hypothetical protein [Mycolicibacterium moriokaense]
MTWAHATPLPHTNIRRWLAELARVFAHSPRRESRPKPPQRPRPREAFIEDAAMAREMLRL